jgi:glycine oxidase
MSPLAPWEVAEPLTALAAVSLPMLPVLAAELAKNTGIDPQYRRCGVLFMDCQDCDTALAFAERTGAKARVLDPDAVAALEPAAARPMSDSVLFPELAQIRNPRLLDALAADLKRRGVTVLEDAGEASVNAHRDDFEVDAGRHGHLVAPELVVAAGAWSGRLLEGLGVDLPVKPVRGQMLWYQLGADQVGRVLIRNGKYLVPRQEGVVLVGSTLEEEAGFDTSTTAEARALLEAAAAAIVPLLATLPVQGHWAGLRPGAPDGVPYIGAVPELPGLWLNTGHYRNGVNLGPASAALLADLMAGRTPAVNPEPYDPGARMAPGETRAYNASR